MAIPIILGVITGLGGFTGIRGGIKGIKKYKSANDTMRLAKNKYDAVIAKFEKKNKECVKLMDRLGKQELEILDSFNDFSDVIEKIQKRPKFKKTYITRVEILPFEGETIKKVALGAGVLLGGLGGAAAGTAGGFAAAGATTSAVVALGSASTGTAIASLSGAALTNATLAALGGGAIAAGGGGIALGTTVLGFTTFGIGILIGGVIFSFAGKKLSKKADEAYLQAINIENEVNAVCKYLNKLMKYAREYKKTLSVVQNTYKLHCEEIKRIVVDSGRTEWTKFSKQEKLIIENTVLLVGLLYNMCQLKLVIQNPEENGQNAVNVKGIKDTIMDADTIIEGLEDNVA